LSLNAAVVALLGRPVSALEDVGREPLAYDPFLPGRSVARVTGIATTDPDRLSWRLIEKVTEGPAGASSYLFENGMREARAYTTGLLDDLAPRVTAPRCFAVEKRRDGGIVLWLEDLGATAARVGPPDLVEIAADLGRFSARWLGRVPADDWLFRGWRDRHSQPEAVAPALARFGSLRSASEIERAVGWPIADAVELIERQPRIQTILGELPQTLCHHDAVASNVFRRRERDGVATVLIDWESVGPGPVGADLASLLFSSPRRGDVASAAVAEVIGAAVAAYAAAGREIGAPIEDGTVRLGLDAAIALRWTLARDIVVAIEDGGPIARGTAPAESRADALQELIALSEVLFASGRRAAAIAGMPFR